MRSFSCPRMRMGHIRSTHDGWTNALHNCEDCQGRRFVDSELHGLWSFPRKTCGGWSFAPPGDHGLMSECKTMGIIHTHGICPFRGCGIRRLYLFSIDIVYRASELFPIECACEVFRFGRPFARNTDLVRDLSINTQQETHTASAIAKPAASTAHPEPHTHSLNTSPSHPLCASKDSSNAGPSTPATNPPLTRNAESSAA